MSDVVNPQIAATLELLRKSTLEPDMLKAAGAGKAYQSIAQSAAMAVQDAADNLRNVSTIGATAVGVLMAQYVESGDTKYKDAIVDAQKIVTQAVTTFQNVGQAAALVVNSFAPSFSPQNA